MCENNAKPGFITGEPICFAEGALSEATQALGGIICEKITPFGFPPESTPSFSKTDRETLYSTLDVEKCDQRKKEMREEMRKEKKKEKEEEEEWKKLRE